MVKSVKGLEDWVLGSRLDYEETEKCPECGRPTLTRELLANGGHCATCEYGEGGGTMFDSSGRVISR